MEERDYPGYERRGPETPPGARPQFEEKLDEIAEKVSQSVSEGVKRLEDAASRIKERPEFYEGKTRSFFASPLGGIVVTLIGILWFFNAVGLFRNWVIALVVTGVGIWMIYRFRPDKPRP